ncbi:DNA repair protein RadA [Trichlorobacter ammonificans]|uniref:DNA repair protein RadA n=1 Tax=Trichlorobacter ammonificans TaxID=2916410 RepID=A0ABN8HFR4_9BACT|nr:DNA repair protein RadA [Trichlorobacter ammonificans]CAH2029944.1 DNA repair protein RadA [Trichlorobacter ammonificans]
MRQKTVFSCSQCGCQSPKWLGKCPDCGAWNSMTEERLTAVPAQAGRTAGERAAPVPIDEVPPQAEVRLPCGIGELDRVLGGGLVPGSLVLIGGDPGIGKSTLLLQAMHHLAVAGDVLYVSGEESAAQTRLRGERLGLSGRPLLVLAENGLEEIVSRIEQVKPRAVVIDSIQTVWTRTLESAPGSVSQVRESAGRLMVLAKGSGIPIFIVGHVTKDGAIAGPRVLEHMVDTVLYFEGDRGHPYRILRAVKNRFGSTNEIGVFEMRAGGLDEVTNPSELFLSERPLDAPGSVVTASLEGSRPLLVEIQALVTPSSYGTPRRTTIGVDSNRLALLVAVLEKKAGLHLGGQDIFLNVAGGARLGEPAADLAIMLAVASSHLDRPLPQQMVVFGEVGLAGEIRAITQPELRIAEAAKLGFRDCLLPGGNVRRLDACRLQVQGVATVQEALRFLD